MTGVQTCALPICFPVTILGLYAEVNADGSLGDTIYTDAGKNVAVFSSEDDEAVALNLLEGLNGE